jgi:hypothetical protein
MTTEKVGHAHDYAMVIYQYGRSYATKFTYDSLCHVWRISPAFIARSFSIQDTRLQLVIYSDGEGKMGTNLPRI